MNPHETPGDGALHALKKLVAVSSKVGAVTKPVALLMGADIVKVAPVGVAGAELLLPPQAANNPVITNINTILLLFILFFPPEVKKSIVFGCPER